MQLILQIYEDEGHNRIRTVNIDGEAWFVAKDVCDALGIVNHSDAVSRLDEDEKQVLGITDHRNAKQKTSIISESGLYSLVFKSGKPEAKKFRKWVTAEVLPKIRKTGGFSASGAVGLHNFVRRFNDNWDRTDRGYFSVISELYIRLYGRFEQIGYVLPDKGKHGKEMRPDNSVGMLFSKWLKENKPDLVAKRKKYKHMLPEGFCIEACQYPHEMLPMFIDYVDYIWLPERAEIYFSDKDPKALQFLPKLLLPKIVSNYVTELKKAIRATHGAEATHVESVPVKEIFRGEVAWQGDVEVFAVSGHPKAKQCFAWGVRRDDDKGWDVTAVLGIPPVVTPELAVKAAIVAHARQATPPHSGKS